MQSNRDEILEWIAQGCLPAEAVPRALRVAGVTPSNAEWRDFLDAVALWLGAILCASAVIFFFAYNWEALGKFAKFGLAEGLLLAALAACLRLGLDRLSGKAALLAASLLVGATLALVGQTYQTGADPYELFAVWALAVLPWVAVSRFGALWLFWVGLLNLAAFLYFQAFGGVFGFIFGKEDVLWALFALDTVALLAWEAAAQRGIGWLQERWPVRILVSLSGGFVTALAVWAVSDWKEVGGAGLAAYVVWMLAAYAVYRRRRPDLFVLAGGVLSAVIVTTAFMIRQVRFDSAGTFLIIAMMIIVLSGLGGWWLKTVAAEQRT
jgi:uncharacterized membrane protein